MPRDELMNFAADGGHVEGIFGKDVCHEWNTPMPSPSARRPIQNFHDVFKNFACEEEAPREAC